LRLPPCSTLFPYTTLFRSVLDEAAREWLQNRGSQTAADTAEQARLHAEAEKYIGIITGGNPRRSELASQLVRERLLREYGRKRSDRKSTRLNSSHGSISYA